MPLAWYIIVFLLLGAFLVRNASAIGVWARARRRSAQRRINVEAPPTLPIPANDDAWEEVAPGIFRGSRPN